MEFAKAIELVNHHGVSGKPSVWTDLGSGGGTFTYALASVLAPQSLIYAIDEKRGALKNLPSPHDVTIIQQFKNFEKDELDLPLLDGVLMANSIHYVADKVLFINKLEKLTKPDYSFLIVEYDTIKSNPWVPFPLDFRSLTKLFQSLGFNSIQKLGQVPSVYHGGNIYSALIRR